MVTGPKKWQELYDKYKKVLESYINALDSKELHADSAYIKDCLQALENLAKDNTASFIATPPKQAQKLKIVEVDPLACLSKFNQTFIFKHMDSHYSHIGDKLFDALNSAEAEIKEQIGLTTDVTQEKRLLKKAALKEEAKKMKSIFSEVGIGVVALTVLSLTMFWIGVPLITSLVVGIAGAAPFVVAKIYVDAERTPKERYENEQNQVIEELKHIEETLTSDEKKDLMECENEMARLKVLGKTFDEKGKPLVQNYDSLQARKEICQLFREVHNVAEPVRRERVEKFKEGLERKMRG